MSGNQQKQMTINDLAVTMQAGFKNAKDDNETLARMVAKGFENTAKDISGLKQDISELKQEVSAVKSNVNN